MEEEKDKRSSHGQNTDEFAEALRGRRQSKRGGVPGSKRKAQDHGYTGPKVLPVGEMSHEQAKSRAPP